MYLRNISANSGKWIKFNFILHYLFRAKSYQTDQQIPSLYKPTPDLDNKAAQDHAVMADLKASAACEKLLAFMSELPKRL